MKSRALAGEVPRFAVVAAMALVFLTIGYFLGRRPFPSGVAETGELGRWSDPRFFPKNMGEFPPRNRVEKALAQAQEHLEKNPFDLKALVASGMAYVALGREHTADAINRLESARELGAVDPRIFFYLGSLYDLAGLKPYALEEYDRYLRNRPDDLHAQDDSARLKFELGRHAESAEAYARIMERNPRSPDLQAMENLALSYFQLKEWEKALALFRDLRRAAPERSRENAFFTAESLKCLNRCSEAVGAYEEALAAPLDRDREKAVQEGKLNCLESSPPADPVSVERTARRILELDSGNRAARSALRAFGKKKKRPSEDSKS